VLFCNKRMRKPFRVIQYLGGGLGLNGPAIKRITFFAASLSYKRKYIAKRLQARESTSICFGLIWTRQNNNSGTCTTCNGFFVLSKTFGQLFALILFDSFFPEDFKKYKFFIFFLHIYATNICFKGKNFFPHFNTI